MTPIRPLCLATAGLIVAAGATAAQAQSRCGATYEIEPGDTLYSIAQQCRVTLAHIIDLNPSVDPRSLSVGADIRLEERASAGIGTGTGTGTTGGVSTSARADARTYRVEQGDTLFSIAQALGVSLFELMNENEELDPFRLAVGELLELPVGDQPGASVSIDPNRGTTAETVALSAHNLRPNDWVTIGAGPRASEWSRIREAQVGGDGTLTTRVEVPDWADPGDDLVFVVDTDRGMTFKSGVFDVVARDDGTDDGQEPGERMVLEGHVRQGAECVVLRTPGGNTWSMVSDDVDFTTGEYVEVEGRRAEASFCQQGVGTIDVARIREVRPPQDGDDRMTLEGRVARGVECYTLKTPEGEIWSLTSSQIEFTQGEYVEVTGQEAEASFCMQGVGTLQVSGIEEVPPPR